MSDKTLVIHTCCAPCSSLPIILFDEMETFSDINLEIDQIPNIIYYFYNPNIHPKEEYIIRRDELLRFAKEKNINLVIEEDDNSSKWNNAIEGFENEPEKGKRCEKCFELRLHKTFEYAKKIKGNYVATVMSISPHKNTDTINNIGKSLENKFDGIEFICFNFKKNDGFLKTTKISKEHNLYRQKYCGCKYSIR